MLRRLEGPTVGSFPGQRAAWHRARYVFLIALASLLPSFAQVVVEPASRTAADGVVARVRLGFGAAPAHGLFVRRAARRFGDSVRRAARRVKDRVRRAARRMYDAARRIYRGVSERVVRAWDSAKRGMRRIAIDAKNAARDAVGRATRLAREAADRAKRAAKAAVGRAREIGKKVGEAVRKAVAKAKEIGSKIKDAVAKAVEFARKAAEAAARAARDALGAVGGFLGGLVKGEVEVPVWPKPRISCKIKIKDPAASITSCVTKVASQAIKVLPWLKEPVELVKTIVDKVKTYAVGLFTCMKKMVSTGAKEAGKIVSQLVRNPIGTVKDLFTGSVKFIADEAGPLLQLLDPRPLLEDLLKILPQPKPTPKKKGPDGEEETDLQTQSKEKPSPSGLLMSIAGPLTDKIVKFVDTVPDKIWQVIDRWKGKLAAKGIKAPFACLPLIKTAFNDFKRPIMSVVKTILGKTKEVVKAISPVANKIVDKVLEIAVGILSGTKLFKQVKGAVTIAFVDSAAMLNKKIKRVKEILSGASKDPEAELQKLAKDTIEAIPFLKITFWVQLIKEPIKDKITQAGIAIGNEAIDIVMSAIRAELFNLLNRLIDWASETIPYASYILSDLGPVIMWIVRVVWDKVIDPIIRAIAQKIVSVAVTYGVDFAIELAAAVIREGTTRLDKLISEGIGKAIDQIPIPGPLKPIITFVLKIYKNYVEPQLNVMQNHLGALSGFMEMLGLEPSDSDEGGDDGGEGGEGGGDGAGEKAGKGTTKATTTTTAKPKVVPAAGRSSAPTPAQVSSAFVAAYRALARDRIAGLRAAAVANAQVATKVPAARRPAALRAIASLRMMFTTVLRSVMRARSALAGVLRRPAANAAAVLAALGTASVTRRGNEPMSVVLARFSATARRYFQAAAMLSPGVAGLRPAVDKQLSAGAAALGELKAAGGAQ